MSHKVSDELLDQIAAAAMGEHPAPPGAQAALDGHRLAPILKWLRDNGVTFSSIMKYLPDLLAIAVSGGGWTVILPKLIGLFAGLSATASAPAGL